MQLNPFERSMAINFAKGASSKRDAEVARLKREYKRNFRSSLEHVADATRNGNPQEFVIRKTKGTQRYAICAAPDENISAGDIIYALDSHWIVTEVNANKDVYVSGYMDRCNVLFKFQLGTSKIIERWGFLDSGVYSTTISDTFTMPELNKQYNIYLPLDEDTVKLYLDKRLAVGSMWNSNGKQVLNVYRITGYDASSENYGDDKLLVLNVKSDVFDASVDNLEKGVCDYINETTTTGDGTACSILYSGTPSIPVGGSYKTFTCEFKNADGGVLSDVTPQWSIIAENQNGVSFVANGFSCKVKFSKEVSEGYVCILQVSDGSDTFARLTLTGGALF